MATQILPAARTLVRVSNYLICITLWAIGWVLFRVASNFLPALRERRVPALPRRIVLGAGGDPAFAQHHICRRLTAARKVSAGPGCNQSGGARPRLLGRRRNLGSARRAGARRLDYD